MSDLLIIFIAGIGAGMINAVVGSGTLITFPALLAVGYPPITANISNNLGLIPGAVSGTWGYRRELVGQGTRARRLAPFSFVGALIGALALLVLPADSFTVIVPVLIVIALVLVAAQPRLQRHLASQAVPPTAGAGSVRAPAGQDLHRRTNPSGSVRIIGPGEESTTRDQVAPGADSDDGISPVRWLALMVGVFLAGIYGGYFGAAQGILLIAIIASLLPVSMQRANALKNLLSVIVNAVAGVVFCLVAWDQIDWFAVLLIALGSTIGGFLGSHYGRRLPPAALRAIIVVVGLLAIAKLVLG